MKRLLFTVATTLCTLTAATAHASFVERQFVDEPQWNEAALDTMDQQQSPGERDVTETATDRRTDLPGLSNAAQITRAQFTALLVRSMYSEASISRCYWDITSVRPPQFQLLFRDVSIDHAYAPEICVAMRDGLVRGYGDDIFRPDDLIGFADAAKILARAGGLTPWADASQPTHWFDLYVQALGRRNAIPTTIHTLEQTITVTDAREMIRRLVEDDRRQSSRTADELIAAWERAHQPVRPAVPTPSTTPKPATSGSTGSTKARSSVPARSSAGASVRAASTASVAPAATSAATSQQSSKPKAWYEF